MPARWALLLALGIALYVLVTGAWAHASSPILGGLVGTLAALTALFFRHRYDERENYLRGYEDGRKDERSDATGWGCLRA
jgi:hypothetical protein